MKLWLAVAVGVMLLAGYWILRPVCVPVSADVVAQYESELETREDRDFYLRVFQRRNGEWYQCKTWISRQFFF